MASKTLVIDDIGRKYEDFVHQESLHLCILHTLRVLQFIEALFRAGCLSEKAYNICIQEF